MSSNTIPNKHQLQLKFNALEEIIQQQPLPNTKFIKEMKKILDSIRRNISEGKTKLAQRTLQHVELQLTLNGIEIPALTALLPSSSSASSSAPISSSADIPSTSSAPIPSDMPSSSAPQIPSPSLESQLFALPGFAEMEPDFVHSVFGSDLDHAHHNYSSSCTVCQNMRLALINAEWRQDILDLHWTKKRFDEQRQQIQHYPEREKILRAANQKLLQEEEYLLDRIRKTKARCNRLAEQDFRISAQCNNYLAYARLHGIPAEPRQPIVYQEFRDTQPEVRRCDHINLNPGEDCICGYEHPMNSLASPMALPRSIYNQASPQRTEVPVECVEVIEISDEEPPGNDDDDIQILSSEEEDNDEEEEMDIDND